MIQTSLLVFLFICISAMACISGPLNIAPLAKVTASTMLNEKFNPSNVTDGIIGVSGKGEWACEGVSTDWGYVRFPWIQLTWQQPEVVNKILLFDRPDLNEHIAGGKLIFSDGSQLWVNEIPNDGNARLVKFDPKKNSWVRFEATDGDGKDLGFSEIEVYPAQPDSNDYVSWVDPYIETNRGRYIFFITGQTKDHETQLVPSLIDTI
ncbi:MAG: discoidin domain-containing protein [Ginsengibacter sp.]